MDIFSKPLPSAHCPLAYRSPKCPLPPRLPLLGVEDSLSSYWRNHGAFGKKIGGIASAWFQKELGSYNKRNSACLAVSYFLSLFVKCMGMLPSALQALRGSYLSLCMLESMHTDPAECLSNVWYAAIGGSTEIYSIEFLYIPLFPFFFFFFLSLLPQMRFWSFLSMQCRCCVCLFALSHCL